MLDGFLSTALEIIIILDVCGAAVYVLAFSLRRASQKRAEETADAVSPTAGFSYGPTLNPAFASGARALTDGPPPLPEWAEEAVGRHNVAAHQPRIDVTVGLDPAPTQDKIEGPGMESDTGATEKDGKRFTLLGGIRKRLSSLKSGLTLKRKQGGWSPMKLTCFFVADDDFLFRSSFRLGSGSTSSDRIFLTLSTSTSIEKGLGM